MTACKRDAMATRPPQGDKEQDGVYAQVMNNRNTKIEQHAISPIPLKD